MFGESASGPAAVPSRLSFLSPFGGDDGVVFDGYDGFVTEHVPGLGPFLDCHDLLEGDAHAAFHRMTRGRLAERTVYDMTFDYNLARLNLDSCHLDAGYRYAEEADDPAFENLDPPT